LFLTKRIDFTSIKHHRTKDVYTVGDIKKGDNYCGVVHLSNIRWGDSEFWFKGPWTEANIYVTPFSETNVEREETGFTDHKVMMVGLSLWEKFEELKLRACDVNGERQEHYDVKIETDLFYGFTRKHNFWNSTSCTLNSWIKPVSGKDASDVVRRAGEKGSDKSKADLINLMPRSLWSIILVELEKLTPNEDHVWSSEWALERRDVEETEATHIEQEEVERMRRFVLNNNLGSKLFSLDLDNKWIGQHSESVKALSSVLQENVDNVPRCSHLRSLNLSRNFLSDDHISILAPAISKCSELKIMDLSWNEIGNEGAIALSRSIPRSITELDISYNVIGQDGCNELFKLLEDPSHLRSLNLSGNFLSDDHISILAPAISKCSNLEIMDLSLNAIGNEGAIALSRSIPRSLTELDMSYNVIGLDGCNELFKLLEDPCYSLTKIKLAFRRRFR